MITEETLAEMIKLKEPDFEVGDYLEYAIDRRVVIKVISLTGMSKNTFTGERIKNSGEKYSDIISPTGTIFSGYIKNGTWIKQKLQ